MSKVGIYTDAHFSIASSILNNTSDYRYSARLDMLIDSFRWMYEQFDKEGVNLIFNAGDLIDSDFIKARESSAIAEALSYGGRVPEYHLVGNHEKEDKASKHTSLSLLDHNRKIIVVSEPTKLDDTFSLLPYVSDLEYLDLEPLANKILISHVTYEGMRLGKIVTTQGLSMSYAGVYFDLILNGHIHSPATYGKVMNIGSIVGHGFDDDYSVCYPSIMILDTDTLETRRIINPYAAVFLKMRASSVSTLGKELKKYATIPNPKCIKVEVPYSIRDEVRTYLESKKDSMRIVATRVQGKIENSSVMDHSREEITKLQGFESGVSAMKSYVDLQSDDSLPAPKTTVLSFIEEFLS